MNFDHTEWTESLINWRTEREQRLQSEYGWLSLSGLHWLKPGANSFGSAGDNDIVLSAFTPSHLGDFVFDGTQVSVHFKGQDPFPLPPLGEGKPEYVFVGDVRMAVIERGGQLAVRVWDPLHPRRVEFEGCLWYEPDRDAIVAARIESYDPPKPVVVDDIVGIQREGEIHAALHFTLHGKPLSLDAELLDDDSYYIIFKDATAHKETYGAGRYLLTNKAEGDRVVIDFNRAYNPPCAFTEFATCPLPRPENILAAEIRAGERFGE